MKKGNLIQSAVRGFFGTRRICYATPGRRNHSANFYGMTEICKLTRSDVVSCIENARDGWAWDDEDDPERCAIDTVLDDLQLDKPARPLSLPLSYRLHKM